MDVCRENIAAHTQTKFVYCAAENIITQKIRMNNSILVQYTGMM